MFHGICRFRVHCSRNSSKAISISNGGDVSAPPFLECRSNLHRRCKTQKYMLSVSWRSAGTFPKSCKKQCENRMVHSRFGFSQLGHPHVGKQIQNKLNPMTNVKSTKEGFGASRFLPGNRASQPATRPAQPTDHTDSHSYRFCWKQLVSKSSSKQKH